MCLLISNECVHVSLNNTFYKISATLINECTVIVCRKVFKVVLPSFSVNTLSVPPVNVANVRTTLSYQCTNSAYTCDLLYDLVPFVQFKKREKHP